MTDKELADLKALLHRLLNLPQGKQWYTTIESRSSARQLLNALAKPKLE